MTCTISCLRMRAQLMVFSIEVGEVMATILPAQAPMVWTLGKPTILALNQPCPSVFLAALKISKSDFSGGSKASLSHSSG